MSSPQIVSAILQISGVVLSIVVLICMLISRKYKTRIDQQYINLLICNALAMLFDFLALFFRVSDYSFSFYAVRIFNFLGYSLNFLLLSLFFSYFTSYLSAKVNVSTLPLKFMYIVTVLSWLLLVMNLKVPFFYSFRPQYVRESFFWLAQAPGLLSLILAIIMLIRYRKALDIYEHIAMWMYTLLPLVAITVQTFFYGIAFMSLANTISCVVLFIFLQSERERKMAEQEKEFVINQVNVTLSQIQPHFLNNALNTIQYLCDTDPAKASEVVGKFSKYIRMNLNSISQNHTIPFQQDLEHLENYLSIETLRFPDITFEYNIEATNFKVPPLTLQPLVENAIKHGIRQLETGGIIKLKTYRDDSGFVIIIKDNGGGFDMTKKKDDGRTHLGINNTTNRIQLMCNGDLSVESKPGHGTTVTITIPFKNLEN